MSKDFIVVIGMARTPIGNLLGKLKDISAPSLGAHVIQSAVKRAKLDLNEIEEIMLGCVLPAGLGQAPARQASMHAGISVHTPCTTINKVCGSGMKAVMLAHDSLMMHSMNIMIAGGMESMTNAPYLLPKMRQGSRLGHTQCYDHMMLDGLEDAYDKGQSMGHFAEICAAQYHFSREQQDEFASISFKRALLAINNHLFDDEIAPIQVKNKQGEYLIDTDERPLSVNPSKIPTLSAAFKKDGTITAGNASSIADGAAALVLMKLSAAEKRHLHPIARIVGFASHANTPAEFTIAPIGAIQKLLAELNWSVNDVDLFEINEAFAVVVLVAMQVLNIPHDKVNIHGGACALGHPIGASGARIIVTLLSALRQKKLKKGIACLCIGGGEATAIAFEMC